MPDEPVDRDRDENGKPKPNPFGNEILANEAANPFSDEPAEPAWDADDERRQKDCFAPPITLCECACMHCRRVFSSGEIWFQKIVNNPKGELDGFWLCPTPNCDGKGFTFDIFPTDPEHPANAGWTYTDDDDEFDDDDSDDDSDEDLDDDSEDDDLNDTVFGSNDEEETDPVIRAAIEHDLKILRANLSDTAYSDVHDTFEEIPEWMEKPADEYDPVADAADAADIIEGDEWKLGLQPGEPIPEQAYWPPEMRAEWEEEQKLYDAPDERPRELDWKELNRSGDVINDDDIPF